MSLSILNNTSISTPVFYAVDSDPLLFNFGATNAELFSILIRTDVPSVYFKGGFGANNWTLMGSNPAGLFPDIVDVAGVSVTMANAVATILSGTLGVTGLSTVAALNASGLITANGGAQVNGVLGVTGLSTLAALTASGLVTGTLGLTISGAVAALNAGLTTTTIGATGTSTLVAVNASGLITASAGLNAAGFIQRSGIISPAALGGGTTNSYAPTGFATAGRIRQDLTANSSLSGFSATGIVDGQEIHLCNIDTAAATLTLLHQNAGSTNVNRYDLPGTASFVIPAGGSVVQWYDLTTTRWRIQAI